MDSNQLNRAAQYIRAWADLHELRNKDAASASAMEEADLLASELQALAAVEQAQGDFKNFHRLLCERFGYVHDEQDWQRDQLSLIEHIAKQAQPAPQWQSSLRDEMVRFVTGHAGTKEAAATEFWLRKMPIAVEQDARDAARYRWLTANYSNGLSITWATQAYTPEQLDAAIDAAMRTGEQP